VDRFCARLDSFDFVGPSFLECDEWSPHRGLSAVLWQLLAEGAELWRTQGLLDDEEVDSDCPQALLTDWLPDADEELDVL